MKNNSYKIIEKGNIILRNNPFSLDISKQQEVIEEVWRKESKKNPSIFNADVLSFIDLTKHNDKIYVDVYFTEYKNVIASRKISELQLNIKQVGVSAITFVNDEERYVLFSTRSRNNTEYPEYIELVPSGNIDRSALQKDNTIDYISKLQDEFSEETGMSVKDIKKIQSMCLVYDENNQIFDVGCIIEINVERNEIIKCFKKINEYTTPQFIRENNLSEYIKKNREKIVPTSLAILDCIVDN